MRIANHLQSGLLLALLTGAIVSPVRAQSQRMAIPSYFAPGPLWTKLEAASPGVGLAIINPNSGPGDAVRADYVAQVKEAKAHGVTVLGYVHTSYGKRPLAEVQAEIEKFRQWYGVDGIFLDEVTNDDAHLPYYFQCHTLVQSGQPKAVVVINPGTPVTEGYMKTADIVLTFESDFAAYVKRDADPAWVAHYPAKRFFHLIYGAADEAALRQAVALSKKRNAGWVYVTPGGLPNPWNTLPEAGYWQSELKELAER
jgi:hypothetical protein